MARQLPGADGVVLSHLEFDLLWADFDLGPAPYPLEVPSHGYTLEEREELGFQVAESLAGAGLLDDADEPHPLLGQVFATLAEPVFSVDLLVFRDPPLRALAAAGTKLGVLAVLDAGELALRPCHPDDVPHLAASVLGPAKPGRGQPVRLPREAFSEAMQAFAANGNDALERVLGEAGLTERDTRTISTLVTRPRVGYGQFAVNGPGGRSPAVAWYDTEAGRYGAVVRESAGTRWVTVAPADEAWIADRMRELSRGVSSVRGAREPAGEGFRLT
ncbi:ESX secretion-associated protein EspG [Amycolatopsis benzoatilytica]|uniref:ESX secretion-associated protein EspG n=1 Tax=Amycolatopsis benzoatilytica TaxID=346045 RepID=UPI0003814A07|nr:ESX secretion-associated protein EspG [Amycolatopsis benzoatilytica]